MSNGYKIHQSTTSPKYVPKAGESYDDLEWRIPNSDYIMVEGVYFID